MPVQSRAQLRLMEAAAAGRVPTISREVAREFLRHTPKGADLPEHVKDAGPGRPRPPVRKRRG